MNEGTHFGEYGGKVKRPFKGSVKDHDSGDLTPKNFKPGDQLSAEDVESWPLQNRIALSNVGKVQWFGEPATIDESIKKNFKKNRRPVSKRTKESKPKRKRTRTRK